MLHNSIPASQMIETNNFQPRDDKLQKIIK